MNRIAWLLVLAVTLTQCSTAQARKWTDVSGKYSFEADLLAIQGEDVRLRIAEDGEEYLIPLKMLSESDQAFVRQQTRELHNASQTDDAVPATVLAAIKRDAANKWHSNYSMQKYEIERQVEGYLYVGDYSNGQVPSTVLANIKRDAANKWYSNYSMQKYEIERQVAAYLELQR